MTSKIVSSKYVVPFVVLSFNLILKFLFIGSNDIALDEPFSIFYAQWDITQMISFLSSGNNPPLYEIILHYWIKVFGIEPVSVRFPSLIFSSLAAVFIYKIALKFIDLKTALFSTFLFTFSNYHIYFAHEARGYALFAFLTCLSLYAYISLVNKPKSGKYFYLLLFTNLLLICSHYFGIIVVGTQLICLLFNRGHSQKSFRKILLNYSILFILYLPLFYILLERFTETVVYGTWLNKPNINGLYENIRKFSNAPVIACIFIALMFSAVIKFLIKKGESTFFVSATTTFFLLPYLLMFIVSYYIPMYLDRYLIFVTIPFYLLIGIAINYLFKKKLLNYSIMSISILAMLYTVDLKQAHKENPEALTVYIKDIKDENSMIVLTPDWIDKGIMYYYNREYFKDFKNFRNNLKSENIFATNDLITIKKLMSKENSNIIYVQGMSKLVDPDNLIFNTLKEYYSKHEQNKDYRKTIVTKFYN